MIDNIEAESLSADPDAIVEKSEMIKMRLRFHERVATFREKRQGKYSCDTD